MRRVGRQLRRKSKRSLPEQGLNQFGALWLELPDDWWIVGGAKVARLRRRFFDLPAANSLA